MEPVEATPGVGQHVVQLPYGLDAAGIARRYVTEHAQGLPESVTADAELLVSELVTNALQHGRPAITLQLSVDPSWMGVAITDKGEDEPRPQDVGRHSTSGRGLAIVDALATRWGIAHTDPPPGKTVWFHLQQDTRPRPSPDSGPE